MNDNKISKWVFKIGFIISICAFNSACATKANLSDANLTSGNPSHTRVSGAGLSSISSSKDKLSHIKQLKKDYSEANMEQKAYQSVADRLIENPENKAIAMDTIDLYIQITHAKEKLVIDQIEKVGEMESNGNPVKYVAANGARFIVSAYTLSNNGVVKAIRKISD